MAHIRLENINKVYTNNGFHAVHDFSMDIEKGEFVVFVGPSGSGKSTTLRMIAGLEDITAGNLYINDTLANHKTPWDRGVAMVFQSYALYPCMSVYENISFGLSLRGMDKDIIEQRVNKTAKILGLTEYLGRKPRELSGGQRQRVSILCALMLHPQLIIADEPVSALDVSVQAFILNFMKHLQETYDLTFLFISHDLNVVQHVSDDIGVMYFGKIVETTSVDAIYSHPMHPYTKALFSVIPNIHEDKSNHRQIVLKGDVPNPAKPLAGCPFHTRCPECMDSCMRGEAPALTEAQRGHWVACHLYGKPQNK